MADFSNQDLTTFLSTYITPQLQAIATRPQKSYNKVVTTPYAREDLIKARDSLGLATSELDKALKPRESYLYSLGSALSALPEQQGPGSWLSAFGRGFGLGSTARTNALADRAQKVYDARMNDLANRLAFDKAMGDTVETTTDYKDLPYGTAGGNAGGRGNSTGKSIGGIDFSGFQRSIGYDPVKNKIDFTMLDRMAINLPENTLGGAATKAIVSEMADTEKTTPQLQQLYSDVSDNIVKGAMLKFIEQAGGVRVADTPEEQAKIIGPLVNYNSMRPDDLYAAIDRSRNAFVALALPKFRAAGYDVTEDDMKNLYNSAFTVPQGMEKEGMYNISNADKYAPKMFNMPEKESEESQAKKEDINALWDLIP